METEGVGRESEAPLLLVSHGKQIEKHFIYSTLSEKRYKLNIPVLCGKKVLGSSYGWMVLVGPIEQVDEQVLVADCCLFNPQSMEIIELPKLENGGMYERCILTKPPTEPDCYILFSESTFQSFCRVNKDEKYVTMRTDKMNFEDGRLRGLRAIVSFQGNTYGFMGHDKFVSLHFVGSTIEFKYIAIVDESDDESDDESNDGVESDDDESDDESDDDESDDESDDDESDDQSDDDESDDESDDDESDDESWVIPHASLPYNIWLIDASQCSGELLMVQKVFSSLHQKKQGLDFAVFRVDINGMKCTELDGIGNRTIFLSHNGGGYCCPSSEGLNPNSIYYTNREDRNLHVFDLEDKSTTSILLSRRVAANNSMTSWVQHQIFNNFIHD